jgi:superfamily II DNA/RNA helicase
VVFSQWLGTHELIARRLAAHGSNGNGNGNGNGTPAWGHVLFSGSVPGDKRGALVERFHTDRDCRLFLSTDAGGVGLNLQHAAAVVVNMDLPWNPAVLEQRIGRVHRMGQTRGVQVVNFVGQGSIEEGMLSVLAFKKSLFAGVLDGGEHDVFLQGTRLSQFMESVEQVAGAMGEADADPAAEPAGFAQSAAAHKPGSSAEAADAAQSAERMEPAKVADQADPWAAILEAGAALLQGLATARTAGGSTSAAAPITIERDPVTGEASVRLPLPDAAVLHQLAKAFQPWLQ